MYVRTQRKNLHSSLYESWSSTPIRHFTLTGTFVLAAMTDIALATNFPCKRQCEKIRTHSETVLSYLSQAPLYTPLDQA